MRERERERVPLILLFFDRILTVFFFSLLPRRWLSVVASALVSVSRNVRSPISYTESIHPKHTSIEVQAQLLLNQRERACVHESVRERQGSFVSERAEMKRGFLLPKSEQEALAKVGFEGNENINPASSASSAKDPSSTTTATAATAAATAALASSETGADKPQTGMEPKTPDRNVSPMEE